MLSPIFWVAPGPAASSAIAGLSASASLLPRWSMCYSMIIALTSPAGHLCLEAGGGERQMRAPGYPCSPAVLLNYRSSLIIATSDPTSGADHELLYFILLIVCFFG